MESITIIDNYRDLRIGDYQEIASISRDTSLDDLDKQVKIISILTGKDEDTILNLPVPEFKKLSSKLAFLETLPDEQQRIADSYKICKFELIPVTDMRKVTTAQYIDFQSFHQAGFEEHFVEILSCLLIPKGMKYNQGYDVIDVQNAIKEGLSVYDATSLYAFFLISCSESIKDMLTYSLQEAMRIKDKKVREKKVKEIRHQMTLLEQSGDGSQM